MSTRIQLKSSRHTLQNALASETAIDYTVSASTRGIDMLLKKVAGLSYQSEVCMAATEEGPIPVLDKALSHARIALVTDGGLVPRGNPDCMPPVNSDKFCIYSLSGQQELRPGDYEVSHQGYNNVYVQEDPNRLIPVDGLREAEEAGVIGKLWELFYTTTGVMTSVENSITMGQKIASSLKSSEVDAVILVSTCGTSTRCGALIAKEIEKTRVPVVQVTNLTKIAEGLGVKRIMKGCNICYAFGNPDLPEASERQFRKNMVRKVLDLLTLKPENDESLVWSL